MNSVSSFILAGLFLTFTGCASTDIIRNDNGIVLKNSITFYKPVKINGIDQWLLIRGHDVNNPILLFLHGGPGESETPVFRKFNEELEKYFTVVLWDQRGAGKTYSPFIPKESYTVSNILEDTYEVVQYVRKMLGKDKVFILGHSWGSMLGILALRDHPELYYAYIGTGQVVNIAEGEKLSYEYTLLRAQETSNRQAIRELIQIGPGPYPVDKLMSSMLCQRKWLIFFGGSLYSKSNYDGFVPIMLSSKEYTLLDILNWEIAQCTILNLWNEELGIDLRKDAGELKVPVYFMIGRHDYHTPYELVIDYYNQLSTPGKKWHWFEKSAHSPLYEEAEKFNRILAREILPEIMSNQ